MQWNDKTDGARHCTVPVMMQMYDDRTCFADMHYPHILVGGRGYFKRANALSSENPLPIRSLIFYRLQFETGEMGEGEGMDGVTNGGPRGEGKEGQRNPGTHKHPTIIHRHIRKLN
jgi:hypothetical protein